MPTPCVGCSIHSDQYFKSSSSPALQDVICLDLQIACNDRTGLPKPAAFKRWLQGAITPFRSQAEITLRLVDEMESCALNATYRGQNQATNVLSFPFEAPLHIKLSLLGDIVICRQVVEREALAQKKLLDAHWAHLVVHGTLHLLGYDHQLEHEAQQMEQLEKQILHHLGYPDPYLIEKNETN